jgi:nucleotide-binding universal stress UspA family protein
VVFRAALVGVFRSQASWKLETARKAWGIVARALLTRLEAESMRVKTILCPVDRSDLSNRALAYATALAREYVARLSVLEVIDWSLPPVAGTTTELLELPAHVQHDVLAHLHRLAAPARDLGVPIEVGIDAGPVVRRILERATALSADLIVLGTHGREGFDRLALGSVAEKVLRKAMCPVLTVPPGAGHPPAGSLFPTILCAVDLSPISPGVLRMGADLARRYGSQLVVAHVVPWPSGSEWDHDAAVEWKRTPESRARGALTRLLAEEAAPPATVSTCVRTGTPREEILACARDRHADLIVLGVSGHGAINRALLGSTAHGVVRHSDCPVLTVRALGHDAPPHATDEGA